MIPKCEKSIFLALLLICYYNLIKVFLDKTSRSYFYILQDEPVLPGLKNSSPEPNTYVIARRLSRTFCNTIDYSSLLIDLGFFLGEVLISRLAC